MTSQLSNVAAVFMLCDNTIKIDYIAQYSINVHHTTNIHLHVHFLFFSKYIYTISFDTAVIEPVHLDTLL